MMDCYTYLALGDSYTIGEGVPLADSFPYQTVQLLRKMGLNFCAPEIIATTGWTTDELYNAIAHTRVLAKYDIVTLLIGVNNQYRERTMPEYITEFEQLVKQSIQYAAGNVTRVFVLSIPDWGITPFATGRDTAKISAQIDAFNAANEQICGLYNIQYINITQQQRSDGEKEGFLATDQLHPSGTAYAKWADKLAQSVATVLKQHNEQF
jgi:lysophospholipase L1-like esterase